jgi:hypothetical protein
MRKIKLFISSILLIFLSLFYLACQTSAMDKSSATVGNVKIEYLDLATGGQLAKAKTINQVPVDYELKDQMITIPHYILKETRVNDAVIEGTTAHFAVNTKRNQSIKLYYQLTPSNLASQNADYFIGELWDEQAQSQLFSSANEADGTTVSWDSKRMIPQLSANFQQALKNNRLNACLKNENITLEFASLTGKVSSASKATVSYGNAIIPMKGKLEENENDAAGVFSLIDNQGVPIIVAAAGGSPDESQKIMPDYVKNTKVVELSWFDMSSDTITKLDDTTLATSTITGAAHEIQSAFLDKWGTNRVQRVNYGDILKVTTSQPSVALSKIENGHSVDVELADMHHSATTFFEITKEGYQPLPLNQKIPDPISLPYGATKAEMDEQLKKEIATWGVSTINGEKFISYPDSTKNGPNTATIQISETLTTGKKLLTTAKVAVNVEPDGELRFEAMPPVANFGETTLGHTQELPWPTTAKIVIADNRKWPGYELSAKVVAATNPDFESMIHWKNNGNNVEINQPTCIFKGTGGKTDITTTFNERTGLYVDYATAKSVRDDQATIEWSLVSTNNNVAP